MLGTLRLYEPVPDDDPAPLADVLWRVGGATGSSGTSLEFPIGLDVDTASDRLYVADPAVGILVYRQSNGTLLDVFEADTSFEPTDVQVSSSGDLFVANSSDPDGKIVVLDTDGNLVRKFGSEGNGDGEFNAVSPLYLTLAADDTVFAVDEFEPSGSFTTTYRIHKFSATGSFVSTFSITSEAPTYEDGTIEIGPDGNLYLADYFGDTILKFDANGTLLDDELGSDAIDFSGPQAVTLDEAGNLYVATWIPAQILKLDSSGNLLATYGVNIDNPSDPWGAGGFYAPEGVAVAGNGSAVFVSDSSLSYAYITAFSYDSTRNFAR
jgi:streptogramin lyase